MKFITSNQGQKHQVKKSLILQVILQFEVKFVSKCQVLQNSLENFFEKFQNRQYNLRTMEMKNR